MAVALGAGPFVKYTLVASTAIAHAGPETEASWTALPPSIGALITVLGTPPSFVVQYTFVASIARADAPACADARVTVQRPPPQLPLQTLPHAPQFCKLESVSTHEPLHNVSD